VARARVDDCEVEMPGEQDEEHVHEPVVDEQRAGETETRVALAVPEQESRDREVDRERGGDRRVELLPGVEPSLRRPFASQPAPVVRVESVELAQRAPQAGTVTDEDDKRERGDPRDRRPKMDRRARER